MNLCSPVFTEAKDDGGGGDNWDHWSHKSCKAPVISSPPTNQHPVFLQGGCPSYRPTNSVKALKGNITFHGLAYLKLTWGLPALSLTTNSSWLPWGRFAMPLISQPMPVPQSLDIMCSTQSGCSFLDLSYMTDVDTVLLNFVTCIQVKFLMCFDAVGWATLRASGL